MACVRVQSLYIASLVRKSVRLYCKHNMFSTVRTVRRTAVFVFKLPQAQKLCCGSPLCTRPLKPSMVVLPRSARCRASTEANPLAKRIRTSACTASRYHLPQLLTARLHVTQTVHPAERQPQSLLCAASRSPRAHSCVGCSTPNRQGTAKKAPSDRARNGREVTRGRRGH